MLTVNETGGLAMSSVYFRYADLRLLNPIGAASMAPEIAGAISTAASLVHATFLHSYELRTT